LFLVGEFYTSSSTLFLLSQDEGLARKLSRERKNEGRRGTPTLICRSSLPKDFNDYLTRMNTHTPELISASFEHPYVETDVWGPGWKGWNSELPISQNVANRRRRTKVARREEEQEVEVEKGNETVGCGWYDLVWTISDIFEVGDPLVDNPGCGTLFAQ